MIKKNECSSLIEDYVFLLERQTEGFTREQLVNLLDILYVNRGEDLPFIAPGDDGKLYFTYPDGKTELIDSEKLRDIIDYDEFMKTGTIRASAA